MSGDTEDRRPTFKQLRLMHGLTQEMIYGAALRGVELATIERFEKTGFGEPEEIEAMLLALSQLSGRTYGFSSISNARFILSPGGRPHPQPCSDYPLPEKPMLMQLYIAYNLKISHLVDATGLGTFVVYRMLMNRPVERKVALEVLKVISDYVGIEYTLENVRVVIEGEEVQCGAL